MCRLPQLSKVVLASLILIPILQIVASPSAQASITSRGLIARWDAKNPASYPGSGTAWKDLSSDGYDATLQNGLTTAVDASSTSVCSLAGNVVSFIGAGTCKINSVAPANTSYSASAVVSQSFSVTGNTSLSFAFSGNATYRQVTSLSVSLSPTPGRITFYAGGKAIPGCKNVAVSSSPFICSWKPAQHTTINITALYDPTPNGYSTLTTAPVAIRVVPRSGTR